MKKFVLVMVLFFIFPLVSCKNNEMSDDEMFRLKGIVKNIDDKIEVEVIESDYAFGLYWVIVFEETEYLDYNDNEINKEDVLVGDIVEISYNGQTMMSYPPQIVAYEIKIIEKSEI